MLRKREIKTTWEYIKVFGPAALLTIVGFIVAYQFVDPAPPNHIIIGTGSKDGSYYAFGNAYREILARDKVILEVRSTAGSAENIKLLEAEAGGVDVAFLQGGTGTLATADDIISLGSLYFEPLWVFRRADIPFGKASDLVGKRIAVGIEGSGTRILSMLLLELNGLTSSPTQIISVGGDNAADMLLKGRLDAACFVTSARSPMVKLLLGSKKVRLLSFKRMKAYTTRYRYLSKVELPEGVIDFKDNIPSKDISLIAPAAQLAARKDFHPALIDLLLQAAKEVHAAGGLFEEPGEFPSAKYVDFPLSKDARRFYTLGPSFLRRYLPFWAANLVDRLKIMLLPLIALLFPFFKVMPPLYRWRIRSRVYRWYSELEAIDSEIQKGFTAKEVEPYLMELDRIEEKVSNVSVPLSYFEELYDLRLHIEMLRNKLRQSGVKE